MSKQLLTTQQQELEIRKRNEPQQQHHTPGEKETDGNDTSVSSSSSTATSSRQAKVVHTNKSQIDWFGVGLQILTNIFLIGANIAVYKYFINRWFHADRASLQLIEGISLEPLGLILFVLYEIIFLLAFLSYQLASLSDPGYMTGKLPAPTNLLREASIEYCKRCSDKKWKPKRAHHCKTCRKCVYRMDHHCNWINNCIGIKNQKYFIIFLIYAFLISLLSMIYLTASAILLFVSVPKVFVFLMELSWRHALVKLNCFLGFFETILLNFFLIFSFAGSNSLFFTAQCGVLWLCSIGFMYMTSEFLGDQYESITENSTTVESYKYVIGMPNTFWNNVRQIFGDNKLTWLLPMKPAVNCNYLEMLYTVQQIEYINSENEGFIETIFEDKTDELYDEIVKYKVI